jgi:hypothetical protein
LKAAATHPMAERGLETSVGDTNNNISENAKQQQQANEDEQKKYPTSPNQEELPQGQLALRRSKRQRKITDYYLQELIEAQSSKFHPSCATR